MRKGDLVLKHKPRETEMDTPWGAQLKGLEHSINKHEGEALEARWKSGHLLLEKREGKKLPKGILNAAVKDLGTSPRELQARMKFAERFATVTALRDAITQFRTWYAITHEALVVRRQEKPANKRPNVRPALKRTLTLLASINVRELSRKDCELLDSLEQEIRRIHEEIDQRQARAAETTHIRIGA